MAGTLPVAAANRLAKIAGMLGSDHPGERANAASAATKILREHGVTWETVVRGAPIAPVSPPPSKSPISKVAAVAACLARADLLSSWEQQFVVSLQHQRGLSGKQAAVLKRLVERIHAAGGAA